MRAVIGSVLKQRRSSGHHEPARACPVRAHSFSTGSQLWLLAPDYYAHLPMRMPIVVEWASMQRRPKLAERCYQFVEALSWVNR